MYMYTAQRLSKICNRDYSFIKITKMRYIFMSKQRSLEKLVCLSLKVGNLKQKPSSYRKCVQGACTVGPQRSYMYMYV